MRALFLLICVIAGLSAGLWLSQPDNALIRLLARQSTHGDGTNGISSVSDINQPTTNLQSLNPSAPQAITPTSNKPFGAALTIGQSNISRIESANSALTPVAQHYSYYDGIMRVAPSVVSVYASNSISSDSNSASQGSGVIVDTDGIILTNLHLIDGFSTLSVVLSDGRSYPGVLIGSDQETDLAVVQIPAIDLPAMKLDEAPALRVGDVVLAIGNPFGVGQTVTQGIVSATRRRIANGTLWQNFVQIDAAINPGNSGGALINPLGQLVGVNTAVFRGDSSAMGIGFSIPAELLQQVVPQIIENGSVARGWLGIGVDDIAMFPDLRRLTPQGAVITAVQDSGPAMLAGLEPMDVVLRLGEQPIYNATQLLLAVSALPPGATVKLILLRNDSSDSPDSGSVTALSEQIFKVTLGRRPVLQHNATGQ